MAKNIHEIRDPIHIFITVDSDERKVLDSRPFQRLRHIHQLAMTYLVYPGATHRRFEHSLGVMELASRVYDIITNPVNIKDNIKQHLPEIDSQIQRDYWRRVLRIAALCHDVGHLPFSHAAEKELLPIGWDHERLTIEILRSKEMEEIFENLTPPLRSEDIIKLAVGKKKAKNLKFTQWQLILSEIIVGDAFGVDRMDYLLRDSYHSGVKYGKFDHYRLIDTLRILPSDTSEDSAWNGEPVLGIEEGGIQSAEALILARYFMYSQVYFHPIRRIYDIHLKDFLEKWLPTGKFETDIESHILMTDMEVTSGFLKDANNVKSPCYELARRIIRREHFQVLYQRNPNDAKKNPNIGETIFKSAQSKFSPDNVRHDRYNQESGAPDFPVKMRDDQIVSSLAISKTLNDIPVVSIDYVFASRNIYKEATEWLKQNKHFFIKPQSEEMEDE